MQEAYQSRSSGLRGLIEETDDGIDTLGFSTVTKSDREYILHPQQHSSLAHRLCI